MLLDQQREGDHGMTIEELNEIGSTVFFRDWEPRFEESGFGFLFHWTYKHNGTGRESRKHYLTRRETELATIDMMQTAVIVELGALAIEDFNVVPRSEGRDV
jgi:hypothetical protein